MKTKLPIYKKICSLFLVLLSTTLNAQLNEETGCAELIINYPNLPINSKGDYMYCEDTPLTLNLMADFDEDKFKKTTSYTVSQINYPSPYPFTGGTSLNLSVDDIWSPVFSLPFDFCFFSNKYDSGKISSNGIIGFNVPLNDGFSPFQIPGPIPSTAFPAEIRAAIYGAYQDIDPSINLPGYDTSINYQIVGEYPCRALVVSFFEVPLYGTFNGCHTAYPGQSYQMVLYEITNIIDVYILRRDACANMEEGRGLVGIMNQAGTEAYSPPGRNTGAWNAQNEAWRFKPNGDNSFEFGWYVNGLKISEDLNTIVTLTEDSVIEARVTFTDCTTLILSEDYKIDFIENIDGKDMKDIIVCALDEEDPLDTYDPVDLTENEPRINQYAKIPSDLVYSYHLDFNSADLGTNSIVNPTNFLPQNLPTTIFIRVYDKQSECYKVLSFKLIEDDFEFRRFEDHLLCQIFPFPELSPNEFYDKIEILSESHGSLVREFDLSNGGKGLPIGNYKVHVKIVSPNECEIFRTYFVDVLDCNFPKGISPNADGLNDYLDLTGFQTIEFSVYNRYGKLVYIKENYTKEWNGQDNKGNELPSGTYFVKAITPLKVYNEWVQLVREN